jgi:hypothetical protein
MTLSAADRLEIGPAPPTTLRAAAVITVHGM